VLLEGAKKAMVHTRMVSLPLGPGWHFVHVDQIVAVKYIGSKKSMVILMGNISLEVSEDAFVVHKRIEDHLKFLSEG
jgi:hypothetical protein